MFLLIKNDSWLTKFIQQLYSPCVQYFVQVLQLKAEKDVKFELVLETWVCSVANLGFDVRVVQ